MSSHTGSLRLFYPALHWCLGSLMGLWLSSCGVTSHDADVRGTSLAYLSAFQRTAEDLAPSRSADPLQFFERDGVWHVTASEVPLDRLARVLDPQLSFETLPAAWIGQPVSVSLRGPSPMDCLRQLAEVCGDQLQLTTEGTRIISVLKEQDASSDRVDHVITVRHISVGSLQKSLEPFLLQENLAVRLAFSPETNQVILVGNAGQVTRLARLIALLDRSPPLCRIQAWVATRLEVEELYFQPQPVLQQNGWKIDLAALPATQELFQFQNGEIALSIFSPSHNPGQHDLQTNVVVNRILQRTVSAPSLLCLSGQAATLKVGRVGYRLFTTPISPTSSIITPQNIDTGITLTLTPKVLDFEHVDLTCDIVSSKFSPSDQLIASVRTREASSTVRIRKGEVLRIAGCAIETSANNKQGLSWLRTLPVLQWLFSAEDKLDEQTAVDVFLAVDVAEAQQDLLSPTLLQSLTPTVELLRGSE